ncbi:hypothetical protein TELCIR_13866 [Teladorsagia circumcincta]|uniref:Uncharacterized protein n=1 Tax=Teladorsagia circumcincta TaxID=45464 RepID=A0A2G9U2K5_TELCI|nr:hypothetical protein TELCIR_13866 [Teladorsagia circumcincta]
MLLNYDFAIEYVNTKDFGQVDALSRLIASHSSTPEDYKRTKNAKWPWPNEPHCIWEKASTFTRQELCTSKCKPRIANSLS